MLNVAVLLLAALVSFALKVTAAGPLLDQVYLSAGSPLSSAPRIRAGPIQLSP